MSERDLCGLTVDDYHAQALALLPEGPAWPREPTAVKVRFWRAHVMAFARVHARACDLLAEGHPCFAIELLPEYEGVYGLPDTCDAAGAERTVQERQAALCAKETQLGGQSKPYFIGVAAAMGYDITITEYRPFKFGLSKFGQGFFGGPDVRFYWKVAVPNPRVTRFKFGLSRFGEDYFGKISRAEDLECRLNALKPAHTEIIFDYSGV